MAGIASGAGDPMIKAPCLLPPGCPVWEQQAVGTTTTQRGSSGCLQGHLTSGGQSPCLVIVAILNLRGVLKDLEGNACRVPSMMQNLE